ncbi:FG-nucleoporin NUP60 [Kluyveromyces lactis]|uniref:KLLA0A08756p n=1 Tax=Kluyveromyces lactis (strain ATCC 8585 / CBS 2359 / DSM 70799 / NBRC 1267 / NRRL Y-1140 / WM37) TaxID=284590 RepID=Q6CXF5_KLULA|nr:uncharacterized protein KLLA0_A08756g [Kluyveromyces lactis]CAH02972.2 KLLA0A08756p [Kluyveromyces lactis]|eukprot:XP_451384.2 uncharacterized protein KLLA0_A08756g [Kluyveromyces lactis]
MTNNRKSYIVRNSIAPYKKPTHSVVTGNSRKPSFFNKIKSFFQNQEVRQKEAKNEPKHIANGQRRSTSSFSVPGGFYDSQAAAESSAILSRALGAQTAESTFADDNEAEEEDPNVSNAKLASFFQEKGDRPLTEMEMEGVISVMKRCRSVSSTPFGSRIISESKTIPNSKVLRTTSESVATPLKATSYTPRYEDSSVGNNSIRSTRSSVTRRIFDYSKVPSPYRTTVYKYSAATLPSKSANATLPLQPTETKNKITRNRSPPKKLSNTASALMSILDGDNDRNDHTKLSIASNLANPYSSHVSRVRKSKPIAETTTHSPSTPAKVTDKPHVDHQESSNTGLQTNTSLKEISKSVNGVSHPEEPHKVEEPNTLNNNNTTQYKPSVSSSLRQTVVAETSPAKDQTTKQLSAEQIFGNSNSNKPASSFSFSFQKPEPFVLPSMGSTSENNKTDSIESKTGLKAPPKSKLSPLPTVESPSIIEPEAEIGDKIDPNTTSKIPAPAVISTKMQDQFTFGEVPKSNVDPASIDKAKVEQYKSMFIF